MSMWRWLTVPDPSLRWWQWWGRLVLISLMLLAAYVLARPNQPFFYQGF